MKVGVPTEIKVDEYRVALTPAGVSKNVARLEADLGVRLFHRSTRRLALTESGRRFLQQVDAPLASLQGALAGVRRADEEPAGTLKVSMGQAFGRHFIVPLLDDFLARFPAVLPDWHFDNRQVDIVGEGFDAAVGGGFDLTPGVVARVILGVLRRELSYGAWNTYRRDGRDAVLTFSIDLWNLTFPAPGDYSFRILVNGSERKRLPLLLLAPADMAADGSDAVGTRPGDD